MPTTTIPKRTTPATFIQRPAVKQFDIQDILSEDGFKIGIYGPEGIGKSSLAALCPGASFADIENSMKAIRVPKVKGINDWIDLRAWISSLTGRRIVGIDSMTRAEDWAAQFVIKNKRSNDGLKATDSIEDFKYKAGVQFVNDEMKKLFNEIDAATQRGVSFIMIAHNRVKAFKDPDGSDFVRYEPNLVDTKDVSNMRAWVQFLDHLAFIDLDKNVTKGKVTAGGSRTIYLDTSASHMSKARGIDRSNINYAEGDTTLWQRLGVIK